MSIDDELARDDLTPDLTARITAELAPGERLIWSGGTQIRQLKGGCLRVAPFLLGIPLVWLALGLPTNPDRNPSAIVFIFSAFAAQIAVGVLLIAGPSRRANRKWQRRTIYALTDRRAIVWTPDSVAVLFQEPGLVVRSFKPDEMNTLYRIERVDGIGDLIFREVRSATVAEGASHALATTRHGFFGIRDVHRVEQLVRATLLPRSAEA